MLKKTITYEDFNGEEVTEDFYFNLTKAELVEVEMSVDGGFAESMQRVIDAQDGKTIMAEMKKLILKAYGQRSPDGKRFIKNDDIRAEFESTEAYSVIFMEMVTDADAAANFMNGVMPKDLMEEAEKAIAQEASQAPMGGVRPPEAQVQPRTVTSAELRNMDLTEFEATQKAIAAGTIKVAE